MTAIMKSNGKVDVARAYQMKYIKGMTHREIAAVFDCSSSAVHSALKRFSKIMMEPTEREAYQEHKTAILDGVEAALLSDLTDKDKREKASLNNTAYALSQIANMSRLEKGLSTSNVAYVDLTQSLDEIRRQREQLQEALDSL